MKTRDQTQQIINRMLAEQQRAYNTNGYEKLRDSNTKEIQTLKQYMTYLDSKPKESTLQRQKMELETKLQLINDKFAKSVAGKHGDYTKIRKQYDDAMDTKKIITQIQTLEFLLS